MAKKKKHLTPAEQKAERRARRLADDPGYPFYDPEQHDPLQGTASCYGDRPKAEVSDNPDVVGTDEADILSDRMARFAASGREMTFAFQGMDAKILGHVLRGTLEEVHAKAKALSFAVQMLKGTIDSEVEGASAGKMCNDECEEHDSPDECRQAAQDQLQQMLEEIHDQRIYLKRVNDTYNMYVGQIRGFCRALPPLAKERKGEKIQPPTPEDVERLMRDLQGLPGLSEDDRK